MICDKTGVLEYYRNLKSDKKSGGSLEIMNQIRENLVLFY